MDSTHWPQVVVKTMEEEEEEEEEEEGRRLSKAKANGKDDQMILKCPRCNSNNTKFCYYNNYSLSQPRYFCKSCRRYWTAGGSLRNIPVGGASRKITKRLSSPNNNSSSISAPSSTSSNNIIINNDLSINTFNSSSSSSCWLSSSTDDHMNHQIMLGSNNGIGMSQSQRELIPFMPMPAPPATPQPTSMCTTVADHCHPSSSSSRNNINNNNNNGLLLFEEGEAAAATTTTTVEQIPTIISSDHHQNGGKLGDVVPPAFWNGIFGGGSW